MEPRMVAALQKQYPRKKIRVVDTSVLVRDPLARELVIMHETPDNLYCYHVPKWEVLPWFAAMLRHLWFRDLCRAIWFGIAYETGGFSMKRLAIYGGLVLLSAGVWALAIAELVHLVQR